MNSIKPTTPYMLRNDGELLECGSVHPYLKSFCEISDEQAIEEIDNDSLQWFFDNTNNDKVRELISQLRETKDVDVFRDLNELLNQEFCRVRTSNFKYKYGGDNGEIYFRLSSHDFNWFDLIWNTVMKFKDDIKTVSVMRDYQTFGKQFDWCKIKGEPIKHMDVEEFLTLPGNPVIEKIVKKGSKWQVQSEKGKNMGTYDTKTEAEKRLKQVEYFKHMNEDLDNMNKSEQIETFINELYDLRKEAIAKEGEYALGNLIFKEFRNLGYLDNLKDLRKIEKGKELSLEKLEEDNKEELVEVPYMIYFNSVLNNDDKYITVELEVTDELMDEYLKSYGIELTDEEKEDFKELDLLPASYFNEEDFRDWLYQNKVRFMK